jgi:HSP20 family molecular chaperone IbpA
MSTPISQSEYDALSSDEQASYDASQRQREALEQATLPYQWTQDLQSCTLTCQFPEGTRAKDLKVELSRTKISVRLHRGPEGKEERKEGGKEGRREGGKEGRKEGRKEERKKGRQEEAKGSDSYGLACLLL